MNQFSFDKKSPKSQKNKNVTCRSFSKNVIRSLWKNSGQKRERKKEEKTKHLQHWKFCQKFSYFNRQNVI